MEPTPKKQYPQCAVEDEIEELDYEIGMRHGVYAKFVASGKMSPEKAEQKIARMYSASRREKCVKYLNDTLTDGQKQFIAVMVREFLTEDQVKAFRHLINNPPPQETIKQ